MRQKNIFTKKYFYHLPLTSPHLAQTLGTLDILYYFKTYTVKILSLVIHKYIEFYIHKKLHILFYYWAYQLQKRKRNCMVHNFGTVEKINLKININNTYQYSPKSQTCSLCTVLYIQYIQYKNQIRYFLNRLFIFIRNILN